MQPPFFFLASDSKSEVSKSPPFIPRIDRCYTEVDRSPGRSVTQGWRFRLDGISSSLGLDSLKSSSLLFTLSHSPGKGVCIDSGNPKKITFQSYVKTCIEILFSARREANQSRSIDQLAIPTLCGQVIARPPQLKSSRKTVHKMKGNKRPAHLRRSLVANLFSV